MILDGYVKDKCGIAIKNAIVEIKDRTFNTLYHTESNDDGYYQLDIPEGRYPFLVAVKDYAVNYLEYWCQNLPLFKNMSLDISFDQLEIYGLHAFEVKGADNGLMVYFRPMSLLKFQQGKEDIAPDDITITVTIDGKESPVIFQNRVTELADNRKLTAYLIQVGLPENTFSWKQLTVQIQNKDNHYGAATIFQTDLP